MLWYIRKWCHLKWRPGGTCSSIHVRILSNRHTLSMSSSFADIFRVRRALAINRTVKSPKKIMKKLGRILSINCKKDILSICDLLSKSTFCLKYQTWTLQNKIEERTLEGKARFFRRKWYAQWQKNESKMEKGGIGSSKINKADAALLFTKTWNFLIARAE